MLRCSFIRMHWMEAAVCSSNVTEQPLSWQIVFQHITLCRSTSFCCSCSLSARRGGLEGTESAELLFQAFIMFTWSPSKIRLNWKKDKRSCLTDNSWPHRQQLSSSDLWLSLNFLMSPKRENNFKIAKQWSPLDVKNQYSLLERAEITVCGSHRFPIGAGLTTVAPVCGPPSSL